MICGRLQMNYSAVAGATRDDALNVLGESMKINDTFDASASIAAHIPHEQPPDNSMIRELVVEKGLPAKLNA